MLEQLQKLISSLIPFLEPYPTWVKALFALWVMVGSVLLVSLILAPRASTAGPIGQPNPQPDSAEGRSLTIRGVELFDNRLRNGVVQVTADVNGTEFRYPSRAGIDWLEVGPSMSTQIFRLPTTQDEYVISFRMVVRTTEREYQLVSQTERRLDSREFPYNGTYGLHIKNAPATRSAGVAAQVNYTLDR